MSCAEIAGIREGAVRGQLRSRKASIRTAALFGHQRYTVALQEPDFSAIASTVISSKAFLSSSCAAEARIRLADFFVARTARSLYGM